MNFSIVRQTLGQALVMLLLFAVLTFVCGVGGGAPAEAALPHGMAFSLPGSLPGLLEGMWPVAAKACACLLFVAAGLAVGRMTVRYNLYASATFMAMSLFALLAGGLSHGDGLLRYCMVAALFAFSFKNFAASMVNGYAFDAVFRGAFYLGLLPLVDPGCAVLLPLVAAALLLFRRTSREAVVALVAVLLPLMTFSYLNWAWGGDFRAPMYYIMRAFADGEYLTAVVSLSLPMRILAGVMLAGNLVASSLFLGSILSLGNRPRHLLIYNLIASLLVVGGALLPAASHTLVGLAALTSSVILPVLFIRSRYFVALPLYVVLAVLACACLLM